MSHTTYHGPHRQRCEACSLIGTAAVTEYVPSGVVAWTCPNCGVTQEPTGEPL